ncbi:sphingosine-1-phosphate transporter SPNS2-like isoform X3 [Mobula birostris]|uniref:sphingosine-1-phosphate transporter SPNS2-like isoform X3 n=1 Tax=Mobula birostris TaxID=1983395 RepID=UPI003B27DD85
MCVDKDTSECPLSVSVSSEEIQTLSGSVPIGDSASSPAEKFRALYRLRPHIAAGVLSFGYVVNYMDRYTVAGVLADIQRHFGVSDSKSGLLPTAFICSFMVATPIFGFLGDRFNRKFILSCGIFFWSAITLSSSFITKPVTPAMGFAAGSLIILLVPEPKRGAADQHQVQLRASTSWSKDMKAVIKIPSFVFSTLASASVSFATGVLGMWIPLYLFRAEVVQKNIEPCTVEPCSGRDSLIFGAITCVTGFLGLIVGVAATRWYRTKSSRADPLVCAFGMLSSSIFISLIFVFARFNIVGAYLCIFIGEVLLFLNWAITADILMYVVIPTRRSTAVALQSFTSHLFGDAGSPYLIGVISDVIRQSKPDLDLWEFLSLGYALMLCPFVIVLGGTFFLATAHYIVHDRNRANQQVEEMKLVSIKV